MSNSDLGRLLKSDEIQNAVRRPNKKVVRRVLKKNPLKNTAVKIRLNPYAEVTHRASVLSTELNAYKRQAAIAKRRNVSDFLYHGIGD